MKPSQLQLEGYYVKHLSFSLKPEVEAQMTIIAYPGLHFTSEYKHEAKEINLAVKSKGGPRKNDRSRWRFVLEIDSANPPESDFPYEFSIQIVGFFTNDPDDPLPEIAVRTNSPGLLYAAAREILASATGRGPYPGVMLPSLSFIDSPLIQPPKPEVETTKSKRIRTSVKKKPGSNASKGSKKKRSHSASRKFNQ